MAHFAKVVNGIVEQVIVADTAEWCNNTHGGVNSRAGGEALHKNYAGIGYTFDGTGFAAPQPYASWTLNSDTYLWEAPTPAPTDGKRYEWNEADLEWVEIPVSE
jgi:hypothetical protein